VQAHYPDAMPRWRGELERGHPTEQRPMPRSPEPQHSPSPEDGGPLRDDG
jgi:hypothetical protein